MCFAAHYQKVLSSSIQGSWVEGGLECVQEEVCVLFIRRCVNKQVWFGRRNSWADNNLISIFSVKDSDLSLYQHSVGEMIKVGCFLHNMGEYYLYNNSICSSLCHFIISFIYSVSDGRPHVLLLLLWLSLSLNSFFLFFCVYPISDGRKFFFLSFIIAPLHVPFPFPSPSIYLSPFRVPSLYLSEII